MFSKTHTRNYIKKYYVGFLRLEMKYLISALADLRKRVSGSVSSYVIKCAKVI